MPNHVVNRIRFDCSEERLKEILSDICYDDDAELEVVGIGTIDFNKIIPMPPSLDIECGGRTNNAINLYLTSINPAVSYYGSKKMDAEQFDSLVDELNRHCSFKLYSPTLPLEDIRSYTQYRDETELLELGKIAVENQINYGATTWYDWRTRSDTWNTKWNSYNSSYVDGDNEIYFQTAWSAPHSILQKLSEMYPDVAISHSWANEDLWQSCGSQIYLAGEIAEIEMPETQREHIEMAAKIWGCDLEDCDLVLNASGDDYICSENEIYELVSICEKPALFSNERLNLNDIPDGLYLYHLRFDDDNTRFASLEKNVAVNHAGSIVTSEPLDLGENGCIALTEETEPNFIGESITFGQFMSGDFETEEDIDLG